MARIVILEGARGAGKSTVAQMLRSSIWGSTLINPTGFTDDSEEGLFKITKYYNALMNYLDELPEDCLILFDRIFMSEMVYSKLYKEYSFDSVYYQLCDRLFNNLSHAIAVFHMYADVARNPDRLNRNKAELFGGKVPDEVDKVLEQQKEYRSLMSELSKLQMEYPNSNFILNNLETTFTRPEQVKNYVEYIVRRRILI